MHISTLITKLKKIQKKNPDTMIMVPDHSELHSYRHASEVRLVTFNPTQRIAYITFADEGSFETGDKRVEVI
jgi:hypothetical protein